MNINKIRFISILCLYAGIFAQNPIDNYLSGNNTFTVIGDIGDGVDKPRDLDFHPTLDNQLWILNEGADSYASNTQYIADVCLPENSDITFTIYDSYGDGICCSYGIGSYSVLACGTTYASGGNFNSSQSTSFNVGACDDNCSSGEVNVRVIITTDDYGMETSWELIDSNSDEIYANRSLPGGSSVIYFDAGMNEQTSEYRKDVASSHFMNTASAMAFDDEGFFANSIECKDGNNQSNGFFAGPTLWDADLSIYAEVNQNSSGSHIDMLHQSPYGVGIEYSGSGNIYWLFDGYHSAIVRYDFATPHAYGGDNHADGKVWRYGEIEVDREDGISSHLILDDESGLLYIVDTGNQRILRFNTDSGDFDYNLTPYGEPLAQYWMMENAEWEVYINAGLDKPSGIDLYEDRLVVSDYASGEVIIYDISADPPSELGRINTGNENNIMGIKIGPDQKIWYVNYDRDEVIRIDYNMLPGDVNFDETVNILDIILVANIVLGAIDPSQAEWNAANVNGDDIVNILDIIAIVNIILEN